MTETPSSAAPPMKGMWHAALNVRDVEPMRFFYMEILGYQLEWAPDADNLYLTRGRDNLAIHRSEKAPEPGDTDRGALDHLGFVLDELDQVDAWATWLTERGFPPLAPPKTHRDGARSFYVRDPEGNLLQFICHPPLVGA